MSKELEMESATLSIKIGLGLFAFVVIIFIFAFGIDSYDLQRFMICYAFGFLGLSAKAFFYHGLLKKEHQQLQKKDIKEWLLAFFFYYPVGLGVVISFLFVAFYENLRNMNQGFFILVSLFLFVYCGFAVVKALNNFLFSPKKSEKE